MTAPEPRPGRSPGALLAGLIALLLVCAGVIVWDQTRPATTVSTPAGQKTVDQGTTAPPPVNTGSDNGFGDLK